MRTILHICLQETDPFCFATDSSPNSALAYVFPWPSMQPIIMRAPDGAFT